MEKKKTRNTGLDFMKLIAAYFVCIQHTVNSEGIFSYLLVLTRVAVPLFFMVTGYFIASSNPRKYIRKILFITAEMMLIYFGVDLLKACIQGNAIAYLKDILLASNIVKFVVFNNMPFAGHGWYLWALIYAYPIAFMCVKTKKTILGNVLIVLGIGILLAFGKYSIVIFGTDIEPYYTMTWYAVGIPFLLIGNYIHAHEEYLANHRKLLLMLIFIVGVLNIFERYVLQNYGVNATRDTYFCTVLLSILMFLFFLGWKHKEKKEKIAYYGRTYSTDIYVYHIIVARFIKIVISRVFGSTMFIRNIIIPILVVVVVTLLAVIKKQILQRMFIKKIE
mgnify:CR=1 FL=1